MGSMDVVLWILRSIVEVFDEVRLDLDVNVVEIGMFIVICTPVTVNH